MIFLLFLKNVLAFFSLHLLQDTIEEIKYKITMVTIMAEAEVTRKRKCGMCSFADLYYIKSKKKHERNLLFAMIES
jgi:hypothetical protein